MVRVGVLALQGAFELHRFHIEALGAEYIPVSSAAALEAIDALIIPGGESGVMLKLIDHLRLEESLSRAVACKPTWGICAGAILLAAKVTGPEQKSFGAIDVTIERNAYGRQLQSTQTEVDGYGVSFIRAPRITRVGPGVTVRFANESPAWVESGLTTLTTFHPETERSAPSPWHRRLITSSALPAD